MEIRHTDLSDIVKVMEIYEQARQYMREQGNPNQWMNGYPDVKLVAKDINDDCSYVCLENDQIVGVFRFTQETDPTYNKIYEGKWINEEPYGVIHRIASASHRKGVAKCCLNWCLNQCRNIRIDTHRDNLAMQSFLKKNGFEQCGIIYLANGEERLAFQRTV